MRLLDRYLFSIFGMAFALVTLTFLFLFTAMDLSSRIARILSLKNINTWMFLANYYLVRLPMFLHLILPAVTLFSSMFTVIQLQKTNELLPMITSGVSLRRLSLIFVAGALVCGVAMAALDEFVLPSLMEAIGETDDILISDKPQKNQIYHGQDFVILLSEVDNVRRVHRGLYLTRWRATGLRQEVISAETMTWVPERRQWQLMNGKSIPYDKDGAPSIARGPDGKTRIIEVPIPPEGLYLDPPPIPDELRRKFSLSGKSYRYVELMELRAKFPHIDAYDMHLHLKFASPLGPLILLFLGLPFVSGTQHRSFYRGIALCLLLTIAYYAATFVCFEMGIRGGMQSAPAVWGPIAIFGLAGLISFWRMRS